MAAKRIRIKDIAQIAHVSPTAVCMALNDRPGVSDQTRKKILKIAKEHDYQPNFIAKSLITRRSYTIGLILSDIGIPFFPEQAKGIEEKANELGYTLLLCNTNHDLGLEKKSIDTLRSKGVDGIILSTAVVDDPHIPVLVADRFPFVCINRIPLAPGFERKIDYVIMDDVSGGYKGATHLWRMGHDRIAVLAGDLNVSTAVRRLAGTRKALMTRGGDLTSDWVAECHWSRRLARAATLRFLNRDPRPTAFFAHDDTMAIGVRDAVMASGLRIPEDISLLGFDDIEVTALPGIDITTIKMHKYEIGVRAVQILVNNIENDSPADRNTIVLDADLIVRKSCGFPGTGYRR